MKCCINDHLDLISEWDFSRNKSLDPKNFTLGSDKKVWWVCKNKHQWIASIYNRGKGRNCPYCANKKACEDNSLAIKYPEIANQWNYNLNKKTTPNNTIFGTSKKVWWVCSKGHEWKASVINRTRSNSNCPYCSNQKVCEDNCLETLYPHIAKLWHPIKNNNINTNDIIAKSGKPYWWLCEFGHEWQASPHTLTCSKQNGCPYCANKKVCKDNSLASLYPNIAKELHSIKNGNTTADMIIAGSSKRYWWLCSKGHKYETACNIRTYLNCGCPYCSNRKVCEDNCLKNVYPRVAAEWHPLKNGNLTPSDIVGGSNRPCWWMCNKGHEWKVSPNARTSKRDKTNCPICNESKGEILIRNYLEDNKCNFQSQYQFVNDPKVRLCKFDFAVFIDDKIKLIEFHGEQHYKPSRFGSKKINSKMENFNKIVDRDYRKEQFCKMNNISLLIIPYWEQNNLYLILDNWLKNKDITFAEIPNWIKKYQLIRQKIFDKIQLRSKMIHS